MDVGYIHAGLWLDYRLRLWAATSASRAVSAVAELLVYFFIRVSYFIRLVVT